MWAVVCRLDGMLWENGLPTLEDARDAKREADRLCPCLHDARHRYGRNTWTHKVVNEDTLKEDRQSRPWKHRGIYACGACGSKEHRRDSKKCPKATPLAAA